LTQAGEFGPMARVKYVLPALVAVVCALAACETTADHRDLFAPDKPQGPYTDKLRALNYSRGSNRPASTAAFPLASAGAQPPQETGPIAPPPPPPPPPPSTTQEPEAGAPAATPMPETALPGTTAPASVPGLSVPAATPSTGTEPLAVPPAPAAPAATPAPDTGAGAGASPAPAIPGLSQ
jgi:hypothetical protein